MSETSRFPVFFLAPPDEEGMGCQVNGNSPLRISDHICLAFVDVLAFLLCKELLEVGVLLTLQRHRKN